jgi:PKD repeat protein
VNFGNISSKYGEGAWNWADVHVNGRTFIVPLLSTVFLTNYTSDIYGKNLNTWKIIDAQTGEIILDVRGVPYFIYTFSTPGYYTLENTVEDANGNVYAATRTSFVEVKDHTQKKDNDPDPFIVNSSDYGYIMQKQGRETFITNLSKELLAEQLQNLKDNAQAFLGSPLIIKDDPDATFRSE